MDISLVVVDKLQVNHSTLDEVDLREGGQSIGEALADMIDMELSFPETRSITITINL